MCIIPINLIYPPGCGFLVTTKDDMNHFLGSGFPTGKTFIGDDCILGPGGVDPTYKQNAPFASPHPKVTAMSLKASETRRAERRRGQAANSSEVTLAAEPHEEVVSTKRGNQPIGSWDWYIYLYIYHKFKPNVGYPAHLRLKD